MKHLKIFMALAMTALAFTSCKKFLEEKPLSSIPANAYFASPQEAVSAKNYLYTHDNGPGSFNTVGGLYDASESFAFDNLAGISNNIVQQNQSLRYFSNLTQDPVGTGNYLDGIWIQFYQNVANANSIIAKVSPSTSIDSATKTNVLATARFFRALDYYYLVRIFGAVPLVLKPYESLNNLYLGRSSVDSVYNAIESDLTWAYNNGGLPDKPMGSNGNQITKGTVGVVLAEVCLTMAGSPLKKGASYYTKALTYASAITSSGNYALFSSQPGNTAFDKLRSTNFDQGSEYLYFIEFNSGIQSSQFPQFSLPNTFPAAVPNSNLGLKYSLVVQAWVPTPNLLGLYDSVNDVRRHEKQFYANSFTYTTTGGQPASFKFGLTLPHIWYDSTAIFQTGNSGKYYGVYRLADAYLIAAEAANELGQDPTPYLTPLLARAYTTPPAVPADQAGRRNLVLAERFRELVFEGHSWFDMLRTGLYPDAGAKGAVTFSPLVGHSNGRGQAYGNKDLLMPIPSTEIQRDPNLKQNPGY